MIGDAEATEAYGHEQQPHPAAHQKRQGSLDIDLGQGNQGTHQGRGATDNHQHQLGDWAQGDQGFKPQ